MSLEAIAHEEAALIFQLEELSLYEHESKGKHRADERPDFMVAMDLLQQSLEESIRTLRDAGVARNMALALEVQAAEDRRVALEIDGNNRTADQSPPAELEAVIKMLPELTPTETKPSPAISYAGPSTEAPSFQILKDAKAGTTCCTCFEPLEDQQYAKLECGHRFDLECLKELFTRSTKDPGRFPPRCCSNPIPLAAVLRSMTPEEAERFHEAEEEFTTTDRLYCSNQECGRFIRKNNVVADQGICPHCKTVSCLHCKGPTHENECPLDEDLQTTLSLARDQGWQRCQRCSALVELDLGCNHITFVTPR